MSKVLNLTDKLKFEEKPVIVIRDKNIVVNDEAMNVLQIMDLLGDGEDVSPAAVYDIAELLFTKESKKDLEDLHLSFDDFSTVVSAALDLVNGGNGAEGEALNDTTT